jgi:hypothetical protein
MKSVEDFLTQGILYVYKRDRGHRPIIVINTERLIASKVIKEVYTSNLNLVWCGLAGIFVKLLNRLSNSKFADTRPGGELDGHFEHGQRWSHTDP